MSDRPTDRMSGEEVVALKFAAHRQLARWAQKERLSPHQRAHRTALASAVSILGGPAFAHGCRLQAPGEE
jgi:hypothetical protein